MRERIARHKRAIVRGIFYGIVLLTISLFAHYVFTIPKLDRLWSLDQRVLPEVVFEGDIVRISHVRNFLYIGEKEYMPQYEDRVVHLSDLETVDYILEPFGNFGASHTFLTFGFKDGTYLSISVETRREVDENFSPLSGVLRFYELMYVVASEQDVIGLRAIHRKHDVYLYPLALTKEEIKTLFVSMLTRAEALRTTPLFYNTITSNCTTNIRDHLNEMGKVRLPWDMRLVLPSESDFYFFEQELFAIPDLSEDNREQYNISEKVKKYIDNPEFSKKNTKIGL